MGDVNVPSDLRADYTASPILVHDRAGLGLPFSKGLMATSMLATGLETSRAHGIAAEIERELSERALRHIDADALAELAAQTLARGAGPDAAERYRAWRRAKRAGRPLVIALAGAPGVGKSTLATRLALRLGINRVVPTDAIREVLRTVIPTTVLPELHVSTYEAAAPGHADQPLTVFRRQAHAVSAATAAVARRLASEGRSLLVEGVHLLPGSLRDSLEGHEASPIVIELLVTQQDERVHRAQLARRAHHEPARCGHRHLAHFAVIRSLQEELRRVAQMAGITEYDVADARDLTQYIVDRVVASVDAPAHAIEIPT